MNYFRGNGGCGLSIAPKYTRNTENKNLNQSAFGENDTYVSDISYKQPNNYYDQLYRETD